MSDQLARAVIRQRLDLRIDVRRLPGYQELRHSQWSPAFETLMRNRLVMGAFRYGPMRQQEPNGYDNIGSAIERLKRYQQTGNTEHLVDAANLCLVEFVTGAHPEKHFHAEDDGPHTARIEHQNQ